MSNKHDIKALMDLVPSEQSPESRRDIMNILLKGIRDVELQLSCKERLDPSGVRLSAKDYNSWRKKAIKAMNYMNERYRDYKALDKQEKEAKNAASRQTELVALRTADGSVYDFSAGAGEGATLPLGEAPRTAANSNSL